MMNQSVVGVAGKVMVAPLTVMLAGMGPVPAGPAIVAYPKITGPSTCSGSMLQSMPLWQALPQAPPHPVCRLATGADCGNHEVRLCEMFAYCCVSEWYASCATRMPCTMFVASDTCDEVTSRR